MIVADRIITSYGGGLIHLETPELPIVVEGRQFYTSFNITLVESANMILR